jgi:uncharacterized paraquat-inducible protein A
VIGTEKHYVETNSAQELICSSCKYISVPTGEEPCGSCQITGYEPIVEAKEGTPK